MSALPPSLSSPVSLVDANAPLTPAPVKDVGRGRRALHRAAAGVPEPQTADLISGSSVLYLASVGGSPTCSTAHFSPLHAPPVRGGAAGLSREDYAATIVRRLIKGLPPTAPGVAAAPAGTWRRGWIVGRVAVGSALESSLVAPLRGGAGVVLLSPVPLSSQELWWLRVHLGLAQTGEGKEGGGGSRETCDEGAGSPLCHSTASVAPLSLELLTGPAEAALLQERSARLQMPGESLSPRQLVAVHETCLAPLPTAADTEQLVSFACVDDTAATAALLWALHERLSVTAARREGGPSCVVQVTGPHPLDVRAVRRSTYLWAHAPLPESAAPAGEGGDGGAAEAAATLLRDLHRATAASDAHCTTVLLRPASEPGAARDGLVPHLLRSLHPPTSAALDIIASLLPLSHCTVSIELASGEGAQDGSMLCVRAGLGMPLQPSLRRLAQFAARCRAELESPRRATAASAPALTPATAPTSRTTSVWSLAALLPSIGQGAEGGKGNETVRHLLALLAQSGVPPREVRPFLASLLGVACLAASREHGPQRAWFRTEARELLGFLPTEGGEEEVAVVYSLAHHLADALLRVGGSCRAPAAAAAASSCRIRILQPPAALPSAQNQDTTASVTAPAEVLLTDALAEWWSESAGAVGIARAVCAEAEAEMAWEGSVAESFRGLRPTRGARRAGAAASEGKVDSVAMREPLPSPLGRLARLVYAHMHSSQRSSGAATEPSHRAIALCRDILAAFPTTEATVTEDGVVHVVEGGEGAARGGRSYRLMDLLGASALEEGTSLRTAAARWALSASAGGACPLPVREWLAQASTNAWRPPSTALELLGTAVAGDVVLSVTEIVCMGAGDEHEVEESDALAEAVEKVGLVRSFCVASQAYTHCVLVADMCRSLLAGALYAYCCCRRTGRCAAAAAVDDGVAFSVPAPPERRGLYVRVLQLLAGGRYREACLVCVRELPTARALVVGIGIVMARSTDLAALSAAGDTATRAAAALLQRVGRGHLARSNLCTVQHREQDQLALETQDGDAWAVVSRTTEARRGEVAAAEDRRRQRMDRVSGLWRASAAMLREDVEAFLRDATAFETAKAEAECATRGRVRLYRAALRAAFARERLGGTAGTDSTPTVCTTTARELACRLHPGERARMEREAAVSVAAVVQRARAAEAERRTAAETCDHLHRQQQRFAAYARRRDERATVEACALAIGARGRERLAVTDTTASASASRHVSVGELLRTCAKAQRKHASENLTTIDGPESIFAAQQEALSLMEEASFAR